MWGRIIPTLRAVLQTVSVFWGNHWKSILIAVVSLTIYLLIHQETDALLQYFYPSLPIEAYKDKVVWIVGASSGIGEALAKRYVRAGASVIISARRLDLLNVLAEDCSNYGEKPMVLPMDLTNITEHTTYVTKALSVYDHIDIVILNAGIFQFQSAIDTTYEQTEEFMKLNFLSYVSLTRLLLPSMMKFQTGQIVVMSSLLGVISFPYTSSYASTKFAQRGYFSSLRTELAPFKIGVSIIYPGPIDTEIFEKTAKTTYDQSFYDMVSNKSLRLSAERCAFWIVKGVYYHFEELWIAKLMILLSTSLGYYSPQFYRLLMKFRLQKVPTSAKPIA
eukprot:gene11842-12918_t